MHFCLCKIVWNGAHELFMLKNNKHTIRLLISTYENRKCNTPSKENDKYNKDQNLIEYNDKYTVIFKNKMSGCI